MDNLEEIIEKKIDRLEAQGPLSDGYPGPYQSFEVEGDTFVFSVLYNYEEVDVFEPTEPEAFNLKYDIEVYDRKTEGYVTLPRLTTQDLSNLCDALRRFRG